MALLTLQAFKKKWADLTGRFKDNNTFDIAEDDYREFSADIADSILDPVEKLQVRVEKLENPAPQPREGIKWKVPPKVSIDEVTNDVKVTDAMAEFDDQNVPLLGPIAKAAVPVPPDGFGTRVDILAATSTGWAYIYGEEPGVTPAMVLADQPEVDLLFAAYLFWTSAGGEVETPVVYIQVVEINGVDHLPDPSGRLILPPFSSSAEPIAAGNLTVNYAVKFDKKYIITASIGAAIQLTADTTGLKPGTAGLLVLNCSAGFVPVMPAPFVKKSGDFVAGAKNYVEYLAITTTEIFYEIYQ